ncbi:flavodoxin domain-containing protein [Glaciecola sp. KUL10]|uniref:flavodoxin domain-containing protein n=1 Tax=Glaciecola sp. (strain KUL10) TaxID=2161813 RepID=UPI000D786746|nr:flavodoxin domain-containing protein [Glaciecola sp. KUL10]GBL06264.1 flavodoxin/nitric oxide synthase [Glaciecola sp. KUL10]
MHFDIVVGSVLGASEYVAEALESVLSEKGHQSTVHFQPTIDALTAQSVLLVCTSTHGAGDYPENFETFAVEIAKQNLSEKHCIIVGLGDSSYDTYCGAAINIEKVLLDAGAKLMLKPLHIDVLHHPIPEETAAQWLASQDI